MSTAASERVAAYIEAVGQKRFDAVAAQLHPDMEFSSPGLATIRGADRYLAALQRLAVIISRNEIRKIFVDGDEACVIYDFVTDTHVGAVPSVEWIGMEDGKIKSVRLIFHSLEWPAVREEAVRRAGVSATSGPL
jgi:limonene-1,2-epoxide hydrolase